MPTTKPRHAITETEPVAAALDEAGKRWPEEGGNRTRLLLRLIAEGHAAISSQNRSASRRRAAALERTRGSLPGVFPAGYLTTLRQDWPE